MFRRPGPGAEFLRLLLILLIFSSGVAGARVQAAAAGLPNAMCLPSGAAHGLDPAAPAHLHCTICAAQTVESFAPPAPVDRIAVALPEASGSTAPFACCARTIEPFARGPPASV